jgi:Protein of unknown function (DUF4241)
VAKAKAAKKKTTKKAPAPKTIKAPKQLPTVAVKPKKATAPSLPLPPPPPPPPAQRDELLAPRDIARLLRYGEKFGAKKIDIRMLQLQLPAATSGLAICDPMTPKTWKVFDRPVVPGVFRVMLSVAKDDAGKEQLAAIVVHVGRPPIAKWTVAHWKGQKPPKSADQVPQIASTSGWIALLDGGDGSPGAIAMPSAPGGIAPIEVPLTDGRRALALPCGTGEYTSYWAIDANDKPICLVVDFDVFTQKDWKAKPSS